MININRFKIPFLIFLFLIPGFIVMAQPNAQVMAYNTRITYEKEILTVQIEIHIQIASKETNWLGNIEIPYSPNEQFELLEAVILNNQGMVVRSLSKKEITTRSYFSSDSYFNDQLVKEFKLHWNDYPYQIRYRYQTSFNQFVQIAQWYPVLYSNIYTQQASLTVILPIDYGVTISAPPNIEYNKKISDKTVHHNWLAKEIKPVRQEFMAPPLNELVSSVWITPKRMFYGVPGSFDSWNSFGAWQTELIKGLDELPLSEQIRVTSLLRGIDDPMEKIKILYHYLQDHIRYVNVDIDIGGMKPYPASYVCDKKYGDCKALTIYMKALLKFAGIPSYYTLIRGEKAILPVDTEHPSQQFNHVILSVPLEKDTVWLENTSNYLPFNYLGTFTQNRHALLVDGSRSQLIKTPVMKPEEVKEHSMYYFKLDKQGSGTAFLHYRLRGELFELFRALRAQHTDEEQQEQIEKLIPIINYQNLSWSISTQRDDRELNINTSMDLSRHVRKLGATLVIKPPPVRILDQELENPNMRQYPLKLNFPVNRTDSIVYELPYLDSYELELPEKIKITTKFGIYCEEYQLNLSHSQVIISRQLQLHPGQYHQNDYAGFYEFIDRIKKYYQQSNLVLNPKI